jgi:hypothetical protein
LFLVKKKLSDRQQRKQRFHRDFIVNSFASAMMSLAGRQKEDENERDSR